jgi:DNA-binding response OmpR family regulator
MKKILIIEDDAAIAAIERDYLEIHNYVVMICSDGINGLHYATTQEFDLILLDLMLPGIDGFRVCKSLREKLDIPILMVTAKSEDIDKIRGLGLGADDYIVKPFSPNELIARVKSNISQYDRLKKKTEHISELVLGDIRIHLSSHRVYLRNHEIDLKNREYELLLYLAENPETVFSREVLYERIWGYNSLGDNATVAVHINRLREKLEDDPSNPQYIQTVWGAGYRFNCN